MNKKKIMSLIMALVMLVGVFSPLTALAAGKTDAKTEETTKTVTLHKILMDKETFKAFEKGTKGKDETEYNGNEITNVKDFFAGKNAKEGAVAKEIAGAYFAVKNSEGKYVTIKTATKATDNPEYGSVDSLDAEVPNGFELLAGKTEANGIKFTTTGLKGDFTIEEVHEKSSYVGTEGKTLTDMKAVPVEITLPLVNNDGVVTDAHVYPKNTEDKPQIDKNFVKNNDLTAAEQEAADKLNVGADYKNYQEKKATAKAELGKKVPYEVKTQIPAKSNLKTVFWSDEMTEGLTFNNDVSLTIGGQAAAAGDYKLTTNDNKNGFNLELTEAGLKKVNGQEAEVEIVLTYSATVNSKAIVDIPEANDITFHYGNTPSKGNTPKPTKPNDNGEVTVVKTWGGKDSDWAEGEYAKFKLVDANTGEDVKAEDLDTVDGYTFESVVTLEKGGKTSYTWKGLKKDKQYKVVEVESKTLSDAEYTKAENGTIEVTNHKSDNPKPLNPTEPKVVNGGKKFVKTDNVDGDKAERLAGAQFIVLDSTGKNYLVAKSSTEENAANIDVTTAKTNLDNAIEAYNKLSAEEQKGEKGTKAKADIDTAQQAYNKAVKDAAKAYKWEKLPAQLEDKKAPAGAVVLTSDSEGKFEITGLEYGSYKLKEIAAPSGFAKLSGDVDFTVAKGSYAGKAEEFKYEKTLAEGEKQTYGQQIKNKTVSIPQTGGMGTVLFTIVGISLMAGAVVAMKRNREEA